MKKEEYFELIKEGQKLGEVLAQVIAPVIEYQVAKTDEAKGVVARISVLHACATILVNGYDSNVSNEERVANAKELVSAYFDRLNAENIEPRKL